MGNVINLLVGLLLLWFASEIFEAWLGVVVRAKYRAVAIVVASILFIPVGLIFSMIGFAFFSVALNI